MLKQSPVRVLQVCTIFLTARVFVAPVVNFLSARNYEVAVACSMSESPDGPGVFVDRSLEGIQFYDIRISRTIQPIQDVRAVAKLLGLLKRLRPTIVHSQTSKAGIVARVAARLAGIPIIIHTAHAFPFHTNLPVFVRWMYVVLERWAGRLCDLIMVDTESVREDGIRARVVDDASKIVVVPMGVNLERFSLASTQAVPLREVFQFTSDAPVVGTVARLVSDKGLECFLEMAEIVHRSRPDARFLIVGEGPLRQQLERQAQALGIDASVTFAGHRTDIPDLMALMDVFVLPTRREGFGVVFAEAMAMERPTVGSRIGPVAEVVEEGVTGYLAPVEKPDEFAAHVLDLLADPSKRRSFGQAGRRRVERLFSEQAMCRTIEGHYRRLLTKKGLM